MSKNEADGLKWIVGVAVIEIVTLAISLLFALHQMNTLSLGLAAAGTVAAAIVGGIGASRQ